MRVRPLRRALALAIVVTGCEPTIELELVADPLAAGSSANLACMSSVAVYAYGVPDGFGDAPSTDVCARVAPPGLGTIADLPLSADVSLAIPRPLDAVVVVGDDAAAADCTGWPVMAAMTRYDGGDQVRLLARPLLDCDDRLAAPPVVRIVDFAALLVSHSCTPPPAATALHGYVGVLADLGAGPVLGFVGGELASNGGGVMVPPSLYRTGVGDACVAVEVYDDATRYQVTCIDPAQPSACGGPGEVVYPLADATVLDDSVDAAMVRDRGSAVVVLVLDAQRNPVAGAAVVGLDPDRADVVYTRQSGTTLAATSATATDASGTFILYPSAPTSVEIVAGARRRRVVLGAPAGGRPVPAVVVL